MAEQQTQNTAIVGEEKVPPTDEVEEGPESKVESPSSHRLKRLVLLS